MTMNMSCHLIISMISGVVHFILTFPPYVEASYFQITSSMHQIEKKDPQKCGNVALDQRTVWCPIFRLGELVCLRMRHVYGLQNMWYISSARAMELRHLNTNPRDAVMTFWISFLDTSSYKLDITVRRFTHKNKTIQNTHADNCNETLQ